MDLNIAMLFLDMNAEMLLLMLSFDAGATSTTARARAAPSTGFLGTAAAVVLSSIPVLVVVRGPAESSVLTLHPLLALGGAVESRPAAVLTASDGLDVSVWGSFTP